MWQEQRKLGWQKKGKREERGIEEKKTLVVRDEGERERERERELHLIL